MYLTTLEIKKLVTEWKQNNPIENVFFNISTELDVSAGDWIYFVKIIELSIFSNINTIDYLMSFIDITDDNYYIITINAIATRFASDGIIKYGITSITKPFGRTT